MTLMTIMEKYKSMSPPFLVTFLLLLLIHIPASMQISPFPVKQVKGHFFDAQRLIYPSSISGQATNDLSKSSLDLNQNNIKTPNKHAKLSSTLIPNVVGPTVEFDLTYLSFAEHRERRRRRDIPPIAIDNSAAMPLADHSPGTSMIESPMSFLDWSQAPIQDDKSNSNPTPQNQGLIKDGQSMAQAILLGTKKPWHWDYVTKSASFTPQDNSFYGLSCCAKLPYICGVDGMCILEPSSNCESFCECASNPKIPHCVKTIPRIKTVMRNLEKKLIFEVATEKRIVIPPELERQLKNLEAILNTLSTTSSTVPSAFTLPVLPPTETTELDSPPSLPPLTNLTPLKAPKDVPTSASMWMNMLIPKTTMIPTIPVSIEMTRVTQKSSLIPSTKQPILQRVSTIPTVSTIVNDERDYRNSPREQNGARTTNIITTASYFSQTTSVGKAGGSNLTHDRCWQCEESGGACVMGNDFRAHCVKDMADGCEHFRCLHGSCISTDGSYSCECHAGWIGTFCDKPCPIHCGQNGFCSRINSGNNSSTISNATSNPIKSSSNNNNGIDEFIVGCVCHWNYTGDKCEKKRQLIPHIQKVLIPGSMLSTWQVIVVVISTTVFLASLTIILAYFLWKRQWIPLRKLAFFFQDYEEDDGKQYDAFISYKGCPRDERFVLNHLYPKLEKELDFRLCLHFRDFPPGHPIANNIIDAIENSRRTIMILSPAYVKSEWCRMEYQKAQHEMLRLRHRLIPVVLEDIADVPGVDTNLKTILDTITYIKWPGEMESSFSKRSSHFWKLLELSMPKKRSDCNRSVTSSGSSSIKPPLTNCSQSYFSSLIDSFSKYSCSNDSGFLVDFLKEKNPSYNNESPAHVMGNTQNRDLKEAFDYPKAKGDFYLPPSYNSNSIKAFSLKESESFYDSMYFGSDSTADKVSGSFKSETSTNYSNPSEFIGNRNLYTKPNEDKKTKDSKKLDFTKSCVENANPNRLKSVTDTYLHSTDGHIVQIRGVISD